MKNFKMLAAVLGGAAVAWGGLSFITLTIGVLAEGYRFSLSQAAFLATLELSAMAAASMSGGYALRLMPVRQLAVLGGIVAGIANIATAFSTAILAVGVLRALSGIGLGWMSAGLNTSVSRAADPERLFVQANFGNIGFAAVFFAVMPMIYGGGRFSAYFIAYGFMCFASAALMGWLPRSSVSEPKQAARALDGRRMTVVLAVSLVWLCYSAVWSLVERLGRDIGMSDEAIGRTLGVGTLAGLMAVVVAAWLANRHLRPMWPLIVTSFATGVTYLWMVYCHTEVVFVWIMIIQGITLCPILAYAFAVAAQFDRSGGLVRLITGGTAISTALGPLAGARLEASYGYQGVVEAAFGGSTIACIALAMLALIRRSETGKKSLIPGGGISPSNG
jgi:Major Facilitator Superfamily